MCGIVQIRNVPDDVIQVLKARAVARGESLNDYLVKLLLAESERPTMREALDRARARSERSAVSAVGIIRSDRDSRS